jgi:hypothetical protein
VSRRSGRRKGSLRPALPNRSAKSENFFRYVQANSFLTWVLLAALFISGNFIIFNLVYVFVCLFMVLRALVSSSKKRLKLFFCLTYIFVMAGQIVYNATVTYRPDISLFTHFICRIFSVLFVFIPFAVEKVFSRGNLPEFFFPSAEEISVLSFEELKNNAEKISETAKIFARSGRVLSKENIDEIIRDLPRHNSFEYISNGALTENYFKEAERSLADPHIYIVVSKTGSAASELISLFTMKQYNHASLSFDRDLKTVISYNGGEHVYPPGLNPETIAWFNKKEGSSILVYTLSAPPPQKRLIIDKVREINNEGSAYNLMGLIFKYSHKPNIMFCSQFVYRMLKFAGLEYFEKKPAEVKPTDLVELDYYRKLQFVYEMRLN